METLQKEEEEEEKESSRWKLEYLNGKQIDLI